MKLNNNKCKSILLTAHMKGRYIKFVICIILMI